MRGRLQPSSLFSASSLPGGLASHQLEALEWLEHRPVALIADATGSGKTAVAAAAIAQAFDHEGAKRAIWVTEAHLVPQTLRELHRFLPSLTAGRWPGRRGDDIRVVSVETLTRNVEAVEAWQPHVGIVDEASSVKGEGPEPTAVTSVFNGARRRLGLTATPVELDATEAYRLLRLLGAPDLPSEAVFGRFMEWQELPYGEVRPFGTRPDAVQEVRAVFRRFVLRRGVAELGLILPDLVEQTCWVSLTPPQQAEYHRAERVRSPLRQATRREKACAHTAGRSAKAEHAVRWMLSHPDAKKVVVFAEHLSHLSIVERLLDAAGIGWTRIDGTRSRAQRAAAIETFRTEPTARVLLGTKVLERGIDGLQHCGVMLSLGASFNPAREAQRIGRLRRPGSPHPTVLHMTFSTDTPHERSKATTLQRRTQEAAALIHGLSATQAQKEPEMMLSEEQVRALEAPRRWLPPHKTPYGSALPEAVAAADEMEFLQAAVRAGHLSDLEGIELALEGYFLFADTEARTAADTGRLDYAASWLASSDDYRSLAQRLTQEADRLDAAGADLRRRAG